MLIYYYETGKKSCEAMHGKMCFKRGNVMDNKGNNLLNGLRKQRVRDEIQMSKHGDYSTIHEPLGGTCSA